MIDNSSCANIEVSVSEKYTVQGVHGGHIRLKVWMFLVFTADDFSMGTMEDSVEALGYWGTTGRSHSFYVFLSHENFLWRKTRKNIFTQ